MAYPDSLVITANGGLPMTFVRVGSAVAGESTFVNKDTMDISGIEEDTLKIRTRETNVKNVKRRSHNLIRSLKIIDANGKAQTGSVSLTVVLPPGAVIPTTSVARLLGDVFAVACDLDMDNPADVLSGPPVSESYIRTARMLEL